MTYKRKTRDTWEIQGYYSGQYGWECVYTATSFSEAKSIVKDYRNNEPYPFRIVYKRERILNDVEN